MHPALRHYYYYSSSSEALPDAPDYASLSDIAAIWDSTGLVSNTNNDYGQVDSSNNIGAAGWKSLPPGPTGRDMLPINVRGTGNLSIQIIGEVPVVDGNGFGLLRNTGGSANFNFLHYNATFANLKWTKHILLRPGFGADPGEFYAFTGNNGTSLASKGTATYLDDRNTASNQLVNNIARGTAGSAISLGTGQDVITPNSFQVLTLEFDGSQASASNRLKAFIDGVAASMTVTSASTAVVTTPTYDLELFAAGNSVGVLVGQMSHVVIQSRIESEAVRNAFIETLLTWKEYFNAHLSSSTNNRSHIYNTFAEDGTKYYLSTALCQSPLNENIIVKIFNDGTDHIGGDAEQISMRKSTDRGVTWSAKSTVHNPASTLFACDMGAGYSANGRLHCVTDVHTNSGGNAATPHTLVYLYSDNDGDSWTSVDLTSLLPADSLATFRAYTDIIENDGALMFPIYKQTDEGNTTASANYLFRSTDGGANWTVTTIRASAATYINEPTIIALSDTVLIVICRNESTKEFTLFKSVDNGLNWTNEGDLTFGETLTNAHPARLTSFVHNGVKVYACYYCDHSNRLFKAIYGTVTDLLSNPITGWKTASKVTILPDLLHYGTVLHRYNDFRAIGAYALEPNPQSNTANKLVTFYTRTDHETTMETALSI